MDKQAQGMGVNTIIIIALGLIVLIIVSLLLYSNFFDADQTLSNCNNLGGACTNPSGSTNDCSPGQVRVYRGDKQCSKDRPGTNSICCKTA